MKQEFFLIFSWSKEKSSLGTTYRFYQKSKDTLRNYIRNETGIAFDVPDSSETDGTSTTGNATHILLSQDLNIKVLCSLVPTRYLNALHDLISRIYVIIKIYNSSHILNIDVYKEFCTKTKSLILSLLNDNP